MAIQFLSESGILLGETECFRGLNLLAHAQMIELEIGSLCGGHGICGGDRVRVLSEPALSPLTQAEKDLLDPTLLEEGYRLGCQCFPEADGSEIRIEIRSTRDV